MPKPRTALGERLWSKVDASGDCWEWTGSTHAGYGAITEGGGDGRELRVHRVAYELLVGPIPDGLTLDHLCRNRRCVNPDHLEPVTRGLNVLRGTGPSALHARQTHCLRGHPFDEVNTGHVESRRERRCRACHQIRKREARERLRMAAAA